MAEATATRRDPTGLGTSLVFWAPVCLALTVWLPDVNDRFGSNHDGFNAAMWAQGAEAIDAQGLFGSRLGALADGRDYGNHPPLTAVVTWVSRSLLGATHLATRLPAVLASVAAICALHRLLAALGFGSRVSGLAVMLTCSTPMFLAFGSMLDTWIVGLPFGIVAVLTLVDRRTTPLRLATIVLCGLCSWQGVLLLGLALPIGARRFGVLSPYTIASAAGIAGALGYDRLVGGGGAFELGWAFDGVSLVNVIDQFLWTVPLIPLALMIRDRAIGLLTLAAPAVYATMFSQHADHHQFWTYWWLIPACLGAAAALQRQELRMAPTTALVAMVALGSVLVGNPQEHADDHSTSVVPRVARSVADQTWIPVLGLDYRHPWIEYETGVPTRVIHRVEEIPVGYRALVFDHARPTLHCRTYGDVQYAVCARIASPTDR